MRALRIPREAIGLGLSALLASACFYGGRGHGGAVAGAFVVVAAHQNAENAEQQAMLTSVDPRCAGMLAFDGPDVTPADRALVRDQFGDVITGESLPPVIAKRDLNGDAVPDYVVIMRANGCASPADTVRCATRVHLSHGGQFYPVLFVAGGNVGLSGRPPSMGVCDVVLDGWSRWIWNGSAYLPTQPDPRPPLTTAALVFPAPRPAR
jgi:hypothetical protein